jgi:hypothetical protein
MTSSSSFFMSGNESVYTKQSKALNTCASMSSMRTKPSVLPSFGNLNKKYGHFMLN